MKDEPSRVLRSGRRRGACRELQYRAVGQQERNQERSDSENRWARFQGGEISNARGSAQVKNPKKILDHGSGRLKHRGGRDKRTGL